MNMIICILLGGICTIVPAVGIMVNISARKMISVICSYIVPFLPFIYFILMVVSGSILSDYALIELGSTYAMVFVVIAVIIDVPIYIYFTKRRCFFSPAPSDRSNQADFDGKNKEQVKEAAYIPVEVNCNESVQVIPDKPCESEDGIKFCFSCGARLDSDSIFCMKCGAKVR